MNQIIQVPPITFSYQHIASNKGQLSILLRCETFCMPWDILLSGLMSHDKTASTDWQRHVTSFPIHTVSALEQWAGTCLPSPTWYCHYEMIV